MFVSAIQCSNKRFESVQVFPLDIFPMDKHQKRSEKVRGKINRKMGFSKSRLIGWPFDKLHPKGISKLKHVRRYHESQSVVCIRFFFFLHFCHHQIYDIPSVVERNVFGVLSQFAGLSSSLAVIVKEIFIFLFFISVRRDFYCNRRKRFTRQLSNSLALHSILISVHSFPSISM